MVKVYLSLGSNLGDRRQHIRRAVELLDERAGRVVGCSSLIETEPWGFHSKNRFLNVALQLQTTRDPMELLGIARLIEIEMGRIVKSSGGQYEDRLIDIDLLLYDDLVMQSDVLTLPHPHMYKRLFVLEPMVEIAPDLVHPVLHKTMKELLETI